MTVGRAAGIARRRMAALPAMLALASLPGLAADGPPAVGWLKIQGRGHAPEQLAAFLDAMRMLGHVEGRSFRLEARYGDGDESRQPALAQELAAAGVAVIIATSQPSTDAARRATSQVPIVGRMTDDPVASGIARSLAQPGGNVTGVYSLLEEMSPKRLAFLCEAVPSIRRVGAMLDLGRGATARWFAETQAAARQIGVTVEALDVRRDDEIEAAFARATALGIDGLVALRSPVIVTHARRIVALAARHRMPSIFDSREFVEAGGLLSYGPDLVAIFRRLAAYADNVLRGAQPGVLPIELPTRFELAVNLRTARELGLAIGPAFLARADEVIE